MASQWRARVGAAALVAVLFAAAAVAQNPPAATEGEWTTGRATFFSAPQEFRQAIKRQEYGYLYGGACEYVNYPVNGVRSDSDVIYPRDEVAAIGENVPDFRQGVCGRCYEIRCRSGNVLWDYNCRTCTEELKGPQAEVAPYWKDSNGRVFPGYPDARSPPYNKAKLNYAQCWDESAPPIFVRTIDICPCHRPEAQGGYNRACCMTAPHFDLSYWAFEKLAHPLYGDMTIQYRAVDCDTRQPLAFSSAANKTYGGVLGGATPVVYNGNFVRGWGYNSWKLNWANLTLPAPGLGSTSPGPGVRNATCQQISGAGGLIGFYCIKCRDVFTDAVQLSIRDAKQLSGDPTGGAVPPLRVVVSQRFYNATGGAGEVYCDNKPQLSDAYKTGSANGYTQYTIPFNEFRCTKFGRSEANRITFENPNAGENDLVTFCIDSLKV